MTKIHIGIVEDQQLFIEGIKAIIRQWDQMEIILEANDGFSFMEKLENAELVPDVVLVDLNLPEKDGKKFSGLDITNEVRIRNPDMKIIILSVHNDENHIAHLITAGAHGYLAKDINPEELYQAIISCYEKGCYFNGKTLEAIQNGLAGKTKLVDSFSYTISLTNREKEVLELICQQLTAEEIGEKLFISSKTVNGHRNNLLQKTGVKNTAGLVVFALKNKIVNLDF